MIDTHLKPPCFCLNCRPLGQRVTFPVIFGFHAHPPKAGKKSPNIEKSFFRRILPLSEGKV
jgi:hypothetical protein